MGSVAFACVGVASESANAQQSYAFGVGATFPQIAYRQLADCLFDQAQGSAGKPGPLAKAASCPGFNSGASGVLNSGTGGLILYAGTGSGNGKLVLRTNDPTQASAPSSSIPWTDPSIAESLADYDGVQFIGSDDVVTSSDVAAWTARGNNATFGNLIQIPALIGAVGLGYNGTDGAGNPLNTLAGGLNLSRKALCGIVSGHITQWNNAILTADNGGVLGAGNITFVHRSDGSGTTFLFSNALATQCQFEFGPNNETDTTVVSYAFPWTDRSSGTSACPLPVARGANQNNWPDQFTTDQCGTAVANPGGGHFASASGSGGVASRVGSTLPSGYGTIGYASVDYWAPVRVGGSPVANVQSQWDITAGTGQFRAPTAETARIAMASAIPQFNASSRANPLAWSLQGVVPNPVVEGAYPISGFTWFEMYQCYAQHTGNDAFGKFRSFLDYLYNDNAGAVATAILDNNGFAPLPAQWRTEVYALLNDTANGPNYTGVGGCVGKTGAK
ncbi:substrate-binding domain-containing protein [Rhodopseudomonas palustris]